MWWHIISEHEEIERAYCNVLFGFFSHTEAIGMALGRVLVNPTPNYVIICTPDSSCYRPIERKYWTNADADDTWNYRNARRFPIQDAYSLLMSFGTDHDKVCKHIICSKQLEKIKYSGGNVELETQEL